MSDFFFCLIGKCNLNQSSMGTGYKWSCPLIVYLSPSLLSFSSIYVLLDTLHLGFVIATTSCVYHFLPRRFVQQAFIFARFLHLLIMPEAPPPLVHFSSAFLVMRASISFQRQFSTSLKMCITYTHWFLYVIFYLHPEEMEFCLYR
jgi:hypothetical protein